MIPNNEAGARSTGTVKRKGSLAKMTNFGYYLDDDKAFIARCEEALASAEVSEDLANKIAAAKEALEKEAAIPAPDMRASLNRIHSPLAKDDSEKEKVYKDARGAVFLVRKAIYDDKLTGMVNTLTSKYASNAKRVLEDGIHNIEVSKAEMEKYGLTGDDVTTGLYSATTITSSQKSKAVAEFIVKMRPQLEKAIDAVKAADAIIASDINAILLEMKNMFDEAQKDAETLKQTVKTTIAAADPEDIKAIPLPDTLGEAKANEGIFSKLANWFSGIVGKMRNFVSDILGLTDEANDEVDHLMGVLEGSDEGLKREALEGIGDYPEHDLDDSAFDWDTYIADVLKVKDGGTGIWTASGDSRTNARPRLKNYAHALAAFLYAGTVSAKEFTGVCEDFLPEAVAKLKKDGLKAFKECDPEFIYSIKDPQGNILF